MTNDFSVEYSENAALTRILLKQAFPPPFTLVRPGTKPVTSEDAPGMAVVGLIFMICYGFWIHRRRKRVVSRNAIHDLMQATERGFESGMGNALRRSVASGVERALEEHRRSH